MCHFAANDGSTCGALPTHPIRDSMWGRPSVRGHSARSAPIELRLAASRSSVIRQGLRTCARRFEGERCIEREPSPRSTLPHRKASSRIHLVAACLLSPRPLLGRRGLADIGNHGIWKRLKPRPLRRVWRLRRCRVVIHAVMKARAERPARQSRSKARASQSRSLSACTRASDSCTRGARRGG